MLKKLEFREEFQFFVVFGSYEFYNKKEPFNDFLRKKGDISTYGGFYNEEFDEEI